jgi:hypothetical protein
MNSRPVTSDAAASEKYAHVEQRMHLGAAGD